MASKIGLTILPNTPDLDAALDLGLDLYLLIHSPETPAVVDAILERRPHARILIRRWGGVDDGRAVADQIAAWYPFYAVRGVTEIVPWNEADRPAEGGWPYELIARRFAELAPIVRDLCPGIKLHWPAISEEAGYASIGDWKGAAALADCLDCLVPDQRVTATGPTRAMMRHYEGDVVTVQTAAGNQVTCTPNHPILTRQGWVPARLIHEGTEIAHDTIANRGGAGPGSANDVHVPTPIGEVFRTLNRSGALLSRPGTRFDFHGDGRQGNVRVVATDRLLRDAIAQPAQQVRLMVPAMGDIPLAGQRIADPILFGSAPAAQHSRCLGSPLIQPGALVWSLVPHSLGLRQAPQRQPARREVLSDLAGLNAETLGKRDGRFAGHITFVKATNVSVRKFHGYVYNLSTQDNLIIADNIITHNCHWYRDANGIDALGRFFGSHFPDKEWFCTEYSARGLNAPPPRLGVGPDAYEACRKAYEWPRCGGVVFFAWRWPGAEEGGAVEEIANDPESLAGIRRAIADFASRDVPAPQPEPQPLGPIPEDWLARNANPGQKQYQRNWFDDGNDCISSSFAEALRLTYGYGAPDVPEMEAAYRRYHPDWDDSPETMRLDWFWQALSDIGVAVEALHQRGPIVDELAAELAANRFPVAWAYLPDNAGRVFHHAMVCTLVTADYIEFWDQQVGVRRSCTIGEFLTPGSRLASSGYAYAAYYQPAEPAPEPTDPEVTMPITTAMYLHQFAGDNRRYRETSYGDFARTARDYGINEIWFKSHQGGNWSKSWDPSPLAFGSVEDCVRCFNECGAVGVMAVFWFVPEADNWAEDADIAIAIARATSNRTHVDLENFAQFWNAPAYGVEDQDDFFNRLADAGVEIDVSAVMRFGEPELTPWPRFIGRVRRVYSQSYWWPDFKRHDAANVVAEDIAVLKRIGAGDKFGVVMPELGTRSELDAAAEVALREGARGIALWTWDWVPSAMPFEFLEGLPDEGEAPPVDNDSLYRAMMDEADAISDLAAKIRYNATPGDQGGDTSITDAEAVAAIVGACEAIDGHRLKIVNLAGQVRA